MPRVSVVIPYYNSSKTIIRALNSVINQDFKDFEMILVDDGSTDGGHCLVDVFADEHPRANIINLYQPNGGPSSARNTGIRHASGDYIAFLDSDDEWEQEKLQMQVGFMDMNPDIMITSTNYRIISNGKESLRYGLGSKYYDDNFYKMLFKVHHCVPSTIIRKKVFENQNLFFLEGKDHAEDNLFFLRIAREHRGTRIERSLLNIYKYPYGEGGLSGQMKKLIENEIDNFKILYKENSESKRKINWLLYILTLIGAWARHFKRIVMVKYYFKHVHIGDGI